MEEVYIVMLVSFIFGGFSLSSGVKHLLMMLISLEFMVLMIYAVILMSSFSGNYYLGVVLLIFSVCEGALGLTMLVSMARSLGGGYFRNMSLIML